MHKCIKYSNDGMGIHLVENKMIIYGFDDMRIDSINVNYCPFCGLQFQPERLNPEAPNGDAIVQPHDESVRGKSEAICPPYQDGHEK